MKKFNCPSCGAENKMRSHLSLFVVCPYCRASLFKSAAEISVLGKISELAEDHSPLRLRSEGSYLNLSFSVVGRIRMKWADGFWNEWCLFFNDGTTGWLAEAQGEFLLTREIPNTFSVLAQEEWEIKKKIALGGKVFVIADLKHAHVHMTEGELPFRAHAGDQRFSADLRPKSGDIFGSLEVDQAQPNVIRGFLGKSVDLAELKMTYLRVFDGW